jgi:riboflavin kinase / FMN adenylyltransferase
MQVVADALGPVELPHPAVVTIGNYDGIHRGQRAVLDRVTSRARELRLPAVVVTFEPHPLTVLAPSKAPATLLTRTQKSRLLAAAGIDLMAVIPFTPDFAQTRAEAFVRGFLHGRLGVRELYVGRQFAFGKDREGDLGLLTRLGDELGFTVVGLEEECADGAPVSSTRIRQAIAAGEVEEAARLLGRPYSLTGVVASGAQLGRQLGWPTANLEAEGQLLPKEGVYASEVGLSPAAGAASRHFAVTNIGRRPSVPGSHAPTVESHILDFDREVYGVPMELFFHQRLRDEMLFPSVAELSAQIGRDVERSREYFSRLPRSHGGDPGEPDAFPA